MTHQTQLNLDLGRAARDAGIKKAIDNADRVNESWSDKAFELFKKFLRQKEALFMAEEYRDYALGKLPTPPSNRAFGGIISRAANAGLIKRVGYAQVKNVRAHCANAAVWQKI